MSNILRRLKHIIIVLFGAVFSFYLYAQEKTNSSIVGIVSAKEDGKHISFIPIVLKGTTIGTMSDEKGHFKLKNLSEGRYIIMASGVGYKPQELTISIDNNQSKKVDFSLDKDVLGLEEIVVSASRNQTNRRESPVIVTSLNTKFLENTQAVCLADGLDFTPGIRTESNCQNCGFTQVRMNGMEGSYSQILINSRSIFSGLAGIYGLELIPSNMIDRIEVVRSGGSTLFGSNAIAGTINVITKEPKENSFYVGTNVGIIGFKNHEATKPAIDRISNLGGSVVSKDYRSGLSVYGYFRNRDYFDENGDDFSELVLIENTTLGLSAYHKPGKRNKFSLDYYRINEFRRGGNKFNSMPHESDIAEQLDHLINGVSLSFDRFLNDTYDKIQLYASLQTVDRGSYYGAEKDPDAYGITKDLSSSMGATFSKDFKKMMFAPSSLVIGIDNSNNKLEDTKLGANGSANTLLAHQYVNTTGVFFQNDWKLSKAKFSLGLRFDSYLIRDLGAHHDEKNRDIRGSVFVPRTNLLFHINKHLRYRLSYALGYRSPQIFDEDLHIEASGAKRIQHSNSADLKQETSHTFTSSLHTDFHLGDSYSELLLEGFYTQLINRFANEFTSTEDEDVYKYLRINAQDGARVFGLNVEYNAAFGSNLMLQLGFTLQNSSYEVAQKWGEEEESVSTHFMRAPNQYGYMLMEWSGVKNLSCALTGTYTGSMHVPHFGLDKNTQLPDEIAAIKNGDVITGERLEKSESFLHLGFKTTYLFSLKKTSLKLSIGMQNMLNQTQKTHDSGVYRDAGYIYGPCKPRTLTFGIRFGNLF